MALELAVEPRPLDEIVRRLALIALVVIVGAVSFNVGRTVGEAKHSNVDQAEFRAWRDANACISLPNYPHIVKVRQ